MTGRRSLKSNAKSRAQKDTSGTSKDSDGKKDAGSSSDARPSTSSVAATGKQVSRKSKRLSSPSSSREPNDWNDKNEDLVCAICFELFQAPHITSCGHTYCYDCIVKAANNSKKCPTCGASIAVEKLVPNFSLDHLVKKKQSYKRVRNEIYETEKVLGLPPKDVSSLDYDSLTLADVDSWLLILKRKKEMLTVEAEEHKRGLLIEFLNELLKAKKDQKRRIDAEVDIIENDLQYINQLNMVCERQAKDLPLQSSDANNGECSSHVNDTIPNKEFASRPTADKLRAPLAVRKGRINSHFRELVKIYLDMKNVDLTNASWNVPQDAITSTDHPDNDLDEFATTLSRITRYSGLKTLATLSYSADLLNSPNIVSSIEFDKDNEFFAIAGVTRKIKLFDYASVIGSTVDIHCPTQELCCNAKISCVAWSGYYKHTLATSDYDGSITIWDTGLGEKTRIMNEHEKRVWSVDWSNGDPRLLASGSDDASVRLWSTHQAKSIATIEAKANVCCVKFCPENSSMLALGSADHCVHYYDFRQTSCPLKVFYGHKKAVSYVKFASKNEIVSASTDSNLKLWNVDTATCIRTFDGHVNEKNFVGLATDGNFIACGSENNSLFVYSKCLPKPLFSYRFDYHRSMLDKPKSDESTEFVSAVAWKKDSSIVIAANSQGAIKVLQLV